MKIYCNDPIYEYEILTFLKCYEPKEEIHFIREITDGMDFSFVVTESEIIVKAFLNGNVAVKQASVNPDDPMAPINQLRKDNKKVLKRLLHELMEECFGKVLPFGILTGIRPTKVVFQLMEKIGRDKERIRQILSEEYKISPNKIDLMISVAQEEERILSQNKSGEYSVYIGIPFCPTKCAYCSFTSTPLLKHQPMAKDYLSALRNELSILNLSVLKERKIRSIYIGGGTPTSFCEEDLYELMRMIQDVIKVSEVPEFTVEAGRPDTITREKLRLLRDAGVTRISVNPQTMNQKTLDLIGRKHSVEEVKEAFYSAREIGFTNINMDMILGLPGETKKDVLYTLQELEGLNPEHITVHTMAIKRGADLQERKDLISEESGLALQDILKCTEEGLHRAGYFPYYMYRQKYILGNLENVGYSKPGYECIYNVEIIEEQEPILAFGAGAVTKWMLPHDKEIHRTENLKDVKAYMERLSEMIHRKKTLLDGFNN